jgi:hypothetical protein
MATFAAFQVRVSPFYPEGFSGSKRADNHQEKQRKVLGVFCGT